jgi:hypothetical protein
MSGGHSGNPDTPPDEFDEFARDAFEHRRCRDSAHRHLGVPFADEVTTVDPSDPGVASWRCDHGVRYWLVPAVKT